MQEVAAEAGTDKAGGAQDSSGIATGPQGQREKKRKAGMSNGNANKRLMALPTTAIQTKGSDDTSAFAVTK